jgi:FG-GAP-like repeat
MNRTTWAFLLGLAILAVSASNASAGQFKHVAYYSAGQLPYQVVAAQLTNTGNLDLVMADYLSDQIVVLLGKGDGTFQKPMAFAVPAPIGLAVGDLNGDGNEDLVVVESGGTGSGALAVFLGHGNGKFSLKASYRVGSEAGFVTAADFNGDGNLDVAETDAGDGSEGVLRVFSGTGKGTLSKPTVYKIPDTPGALAAADLNGDHRPDLAVVQYATGSVGVLINDGTGHFKRPVTYNAGGGEVEDVKIADLRNDGRNDLVIANGSQGMVILLNKRNGTFGKPTIYEPTFFNWQPPNACVVADFNLDGKLDVACATQGEDSYFFYGKGDGTFAAAIPIADTIKNQGGYSIASGDFNNDHAPDLAIPIFEYGKVAILLNTK